MKTMKKFLKYLLIFVSLYILFDLLILLGTKGLQKDIKKYTILTNSPKIEIKEAKGSYSNINIKLSIKNDTKELINKTYLKFSFYNKSEKYLMSKYEEINKLNVGETKIFNLNYDLNNVDLFEVELTQEYIPEPEREPTQFEKTVSKWWPAIAVVSIIYLLP